LATIEGKNIIIEYRYVGGKRGQAPQILADLVRNKPDTIVVSAGDPWIEAAKNATSTIPIIIAGQGSDPAKSHFVESLARPGGNVTGFTALSNELGAKRLELLKEIVPKLTRVAVLYGANLPGTSGEVKDLPTAARVLRVTVRDWEIRGVDDFDRTFAAIKKERPDGLYVPGGGAVMSTNVKRVTDFALKNRLPSVYTRRNP
jgi:putative ABC transport system substrate-binding protein